MPVKTPLARLSYAKLHTPEQNANGKDKYSAMLIFEPGADLSALEGAAMEAAIDHYGSKEKLPSAIKKKSLAKGSGWPFRDGEDQDGKDGHEEGGLYVNVSTYGSAPKVVRKEKNVLHKVTEDEIKSGDYVKAMLTAKGFKVDGNSGVTFYLGNVLFVKVGDALGGGGTDPNNDFDDEDDSEAEDISDKADDDDDDIM
jgi:hypothetical protein|tara:strand:- start:6354 stop:6947 length:594 start_codon:yes stop_codon:yes gene_type:complete